MKYDFDHRADRSAAVWLKDAFTPEAVRRSGLLSYRGAEFEFPTCPAYSKGVAAAALKGVFGYTLCGEPYLERIKWWMEAVRGCSVCKEWIVPTHGTIFSLATAIRMATAPGENIMILTPGYNRYEQAAARLGRGTVKIPLLENKGVYTMDWEGLEAAMSRTDNKLLVLCNPNNPTGNIFTREELGRIALLSERYQVLVFSDEIFAEVVFEGNRAEVYASVAGEKGLAITCISMGKVFSLTGVNHANVMLPNEQLRERYIAQRNADHYGSIDPMVYAGLVAAYSEEGREWLEELKSYVWENYKLLESFMRSYLPEAVVSRPQGTYVAWIDYTGLGYTKEELRELLEADGLFAGDEGEDYYGKECCVRYSIAVPRADLERSLEQLRRALGRSGRKREGSAAV